MLLLFFSYTNSAKLRLYKANNVVTEIKCKKQLNMFQKAL